MAEQWPQCDGAILLKQRAQSGPRQLLQSFIAPLAHLLDLIRARKLKPQEVPAGQITEAFGAQLEISPSIDLVDIGEFAAIAAHLLLFKSRELAPFLSGNEEEPPVPHASRGPGELSAFDQTVQSLARRHAAVLESFARAEYAEPPRREVELLPINPVRLASAFDVQMTVATEQGIRTIPPPIFLRLEMATRMLRQSLLKLRRLSLVAMIREDKLDRAATVVYFLAVLDLARTGTVEVWQKSAFADILLFNRRSASGDPDEELEAG